MASEHIQKDIPLARWQSEVGQIYCNQKVSGNELMFNLCKGEICLQERKEERGRRRRQNRLQGSRGSEV